MYLPNVITLSCLVISASAFDYADFIPLHRRQEPGTPAYDCHTSCGGVIVSSRSDSFCDSDSFKTQLSDCLKCAEEFDIWKYYGNSVSKAATSCDLDATPEGADNTTIVQPTSTADAESSTSTIDASTKTAITSAETEQTIATSEVTTNLSSYTPSFTTTASAAGTSHPVTSAASTPRLGSNIPTGQTAASSPSSSTPIFNSASTLSGNMWIGIAVGSFIVAVLNN